ncbi:uncharacterized protein [Periplaneta americana]|uniref:uncharacterized protein n=1 Tax=Periplaneta americana TaxID=6978 RepID=UPI0037E75D4A
MGASGKIAVLVAPLMTALLIHWSWIVELGVQSLLASNEACWYDPVEYGMYCRAANLTEVPQTNKWFVKLLFLDRNDLAHLRRDIFISKHITDLEWLSLRSCSLRYIEEGSFRGLQNTIKYLDLSENAISEIGSEMFRNLTRLEVLLLSGNKIIRLNFGIFDDLISLRKLDLSNNLISYINSDVFSRSSSLVSLWLNSNKFSYIDPNTFTYFVGLRHLYLGDNINFQFPENSPLFTLPNLEELSLMKCNISYISSSWFQNLGKIKFLYLYGNNLKGIDVKVLTNLSSLQYLDLDDNPLHCDCDLLDLWKWCFEHQIDVTIAHCSTPKELNGTWWGVLEKAQCFDGNITFLEGYQSIIVPQQEIYTVFALSGKYIVTIAIQILNVVGLVGNAIVLITIFQNADMRTVPNTLVANLAISDLLFQSLHMFLCVTYHATGFSPFTYAQHIMLHFLHTCFGVSIFSVVNLSIHRYYSVISPFNSRANSRRIRIVTCLCILATWIFAFVICIPQAIATFITMNYSYNGYTLYVFHMNMFYMFAFSVFPLCIMGSLYLLLALHLARSHRFVATDSRSPRRFGNAGIVVGLVILFIISIVPLYVLSTCIAWFVHKYAHDLLYDDSPAHRYPDYIRIVYKLGNSIYYIIFLSNINASCNPIALFLSSKNFRKYFKQYLFCCCKKKSKTENRVPVIEMNNIA